MTALLLLAQLWMGIVPKYPVLLEGNWAGCREDERAFTYCLSSKCLWVLHMGPDDEFALYAYPDPPDGPHDHNARPR